MAWITDSLTNAIAYAGRLNPFARNSTSTALPNIFGHQLALAAYMSSGMMRKTIVIPAADRTQKWRDWQAEKDDIAKIEAEEKRLGLRAKTKHAEILRGIGGGAMILVTAGDHSQPLTPDQVRPDGLVAVNVVSRWEITPKDFDKNLASPTYREPAMFEITDGTGQQRIHPSRVICFRGDPLPAGSSVGDEEAFWGDSRLLRVWREVENSDHAQAWFVELVKKAKLLRIGIPDLLDMSATAEGRQTLNERIALIGTGESTLNATVYRSGTGPDDPGEKIDDYQVNWTGIPAFMDALDQRVAAVSDIPFTRLMGRSPAGMNATGKSDQDNYWTMVSDGQENETRPCLEKVDALLLRSAGASKPDDVTWRWAPLWTPTEAEEATTFKTFMDGFEKAQNTGAIPDEAFSEAFQNWMEEREYMPGLGAALAKIPESERFGLSPDDDGSDPSSLQAKGGDRTSAGAGGDLEVSPPRRAANDAWMMGDWAAKPLYVSRAVLNRADIVKWAKEQGFTDVVDDLHVTITYSRTPVDWMAMGESWRGKLEIEAGGPRLVEALGPDGKYKALLFTAYELVSRNAEMREKGASFDWPEYQPHISIQVGGDIDLAKVKPYTGKIVLGPEIFETIREN